MFNAGEIANRDERGVGSVKTDLKNAGRRYSYMS
jgi:hypothetical protein